MENENKYYNLEAEYAIVGTIMKNPATILQVIKEIEVHDFYLTQIQNMYSLCLKLHNANQTIDPLIISEKGNYSLEELTKILTTYALEANLPRYIEIVKKKSNLRKLYKKTKEAFSLVENFDNGDVDKLINDVKSTIKIETKTNDKTISDISNQYLEELEYRYQNKGKTGDLYGIPWLDKFTCGTHRKELSILAARPKRGKTALAGNIILKKAIEGKRVVLFSLEMGDTELLNRLVCNLSNINANKTRSGYLNDDDFRAILETVGDIAEYDVNLIDNKFTIEDIKNKCRELNIEKQLDYIVIDYLQLCKTKERHTGENERFTIISRECKLLAKELNVPILLLSQLNRKCEIEKREPNMADLRSCGAIEQDADLIMFLWDKLDNDNELDKKKLKEDEREVNITIAAQRSGVSFVSSKLKFVGSRFRFEELEEISEANKKHIEKMIGRYEK